MTDSAHPRPRQVTIAAWLVIGGSALVVFSAYQEIGSLRSLETRETIHDLLSEPPLAALDLGVERALQLLQVFAMVAAACSVATGVLGVQILKRSSSARLLATLLAVPPFLTGFFVTWGMISSVVLAAMVMLWMQPARNWFKGLPLPEPPTRARRAAQHDRTGGGGAPYSGASGSPSDGPAPYRGYGTTATLAASGGMSPQVDRRPPTVLGAAVVTWVGAGLTLVLMMFIASLALTAPEWVHTELGRQQPDLAETADLTVAELRRTMLLTAALSSVWALTAAVLAAFVLRRAGWARYALLLSAGATAGVCLLGVLNTVLMIVPLTLALTASYLLLHPLTREWFATAPIGGSSDE